MLNSVFELSADIHEHGTRVMNESMIQHWLNEYVALYTGNINICETGREGEITDEMIKNSDARKLLATDPAIINPPVDKLILKVAKTWKSLKGKNAAIRQRVLSTLTAHLVRVLACLDMQTVSCY